MTYALLTLSFGLSMPHLRISTDVAKRETCI